MNGQQPGAAMQGLQVPISITPPPPESTPPPSLNSPEEVMTYLLGKVGALEKEITRVGRELAWTQ
jgi:hypothetical protein